MTAPKTTRLFKSPIDTPRAHAEKRNFCSVRLEIAIKRPKSRHIENGNQMEEGQATGSCDTASQAPLTKPTRIGNVRALGCMKMGISLERSRLGAALPGAATCTSGAAGSARTMVQF